MSMRKFLENESKLKLIVSVLALVVGLGLLVSTLTRANDGGLMDDKWMYDLNTGKLVRAEATLLPPAASDSGSFNYPGIGADGALVDAIVYSYGDPSAVQEGMTIQDLESVDAKLAYLRMATREYRDALAQDQSMTRIDMIGSPDGARWDSPMSAFGMQLVRDATEPGESGDLPKLTRP